ELILEDDPVVGHAIEGKLPTNRGADLRRARRDEVDERRLPAALGRRLDHLDQLRDPGNVDLVLGTLERRPEKRAERVELAPEIRLVQVPSAEERRGGHRRGRGPRAFESHRAVAAVSAISAGTRSRTALAATLTALPVACAVGRP